MRRTRHIGSEEENKKLDETKIWFWRITGETVEKSKIKILLFN